ncbi:VCBS repeat-containing protein [Aestuariivivens sediminicola]|uniref:VCBS repeat-containing protein n=1 Tax=Aestuariivivens sediminicola TaxID=2913560 RepID=UPI001F569EBB|nr:VCBS repeat-containing protein [Aestuariivivens sediminicola]
MKNLISCVFIAILIFGCNGNDAFLVLADVGNKSTIEASQFTLLPHEETHVDFENRVEESPEMSFLNFANIYNGGGVATADFNNDGLVDIFFVANQNNNELYINKGNFEFENVTEGSGLEDPYGWSTGVSVVDVNNDGWLDIYICKSGTPLTQYSMVNRLYINQKDNTFIDKAAEWKVDTPSFSTQSYFFDYDKDGDMDLYLLNHRPDFENTGRLRMTVERAVSRFSSDIFYRNDGTHFTEITHEAGVVNKAWGLSASIGDFNGDDWPDVYVCNDFYTPDMLYVNNGDGTFKNKILDMMNHISFSSMGSDYADINNDLLPDLIVLEMAPEDHIRSKKNMASMNTSSFYDMVKNEYHHQYMVNTLQLNRGNGQFSEIAQLSGVAKTDWSWAPLIADYDNDGLKDIFITNGILKDMGDQDFRTKLGELYAQKGNPDFEEVTALQPSNKLKNYAYKNSGNLKFTNATSSWGLNSKTQSNGSAYADFDNDGDLDLVINNINDKAQIYRNNDTHNFIQIRLIGNPNNTAAIGTKVTISVNGEKQYQELYTSRGFLSSVHNILNFGIGEATTIDEVLVEWPGNTITRLTELKANQIIVLNEKEAKVPKSEKIEEQQTVFKQVAPDQLGISFKHLENEHDDFKEQILLPHSQSTNGPFVDKADVNKDGLEDIFIGGAKGQSGVLYIQKADGGFEKRSDAVWEMDKDYEDLGVLFFDADNDGDQDLYVVSGGSEFEQGSMYYQDRLYINDGNGDFTKSLDRLPKISSSGQCVKASDIDGDGDLDLFVGGRVIADKYPYPPLSYILINENNKFIDKTESVCPQIRNVGLVTDAIFTDYDNDGDDDLIVVGEWMPITIFQNNNGVLEAVEDVLQDTEGLWFSIEAEDIDKDGDVDYFIGNLGLNTKFKASKEKPFHVFCDDFDNSGTYDIVLTSNYKGYLVPSRGRECSSQQMPFIKEKFPTYTEFAEAKLEDIYGEEALERALHLKATTLKSIFLENTGEGFIIKELPREFQIAPIMDFEFLDIDKDGSNEIIAIGNHYNSEVETVRYDASYGNVMAFNKGDFKVYDLSATGFLNIGNSKDVITLKHSDGNMILVTNNNDHVNLFSCCE